MDWLWNNTKKIGQINVESMQHHNNKYEQFLQSCLTFFQPEQFLQSCLTFFQPEPKDQLPTNH